MQGDIEFLKVDLLGRVFLEEVFLFYDEPHLFLCRNLFGHKFMCLLADIDDFSKKWLFAPISESRFAQIKSNSISIKDVFKKAEDGFVWIIVQFDNDKSVKAEQMDIECLTNDILPLDSIYLDWEGDEMLPTANDNIIETAIEERRDIIDISIESGDGHIREIGCEVLGNTLINFQNLIFSLAHKDDSIKGKIPYVIRRKSSMQVAGYFAASFGVRLKSDDIADIMNDTSMSSILDELSALLDTKNDQQKLRRFLEFQSKRAILKYRNLIRTLVSANSGIKIEIASPNQHYFNASFSTTELAQNLKLLDGEIDNMVEILTLYGEMVGANLEKKTFYFISVDEEVISGKLSDDLIDNTFKVRQHVEAKIEKKIIINDLTLDEKYVYKLLSFEEIVK